MKNRLLIISLVLVALIPLAIPLNHANAAAPPAGAYELIIDTIAGGGPVTLDPANCYDTASAELLFNLYETLIFFDGERYDSFIPQLADQAWVAPRDPAAPDYTNFTVYFRIRNRDFGNVTNFDPAMPIGSQWRMGTFCTGVPTGDEYQLIVWEDDNLDGVLSMGDEVMMLWKAYPWKIYKFYVSMYAPCPAGPDVFWYMTLCPKYVTYCRTDLDPFPTWAQYYLTTADVEHSFERWMVYDYVGGPQWMIYEPLLNTYGADDTWPADTSNPINGAVQSNATHVWLNIANVGLASTTATSFAPVPMFNEQTERQRGTFWNDVAVLPLGYPLRILFQVISQSWASIMSEPWLVNYVSPNAIAAGHPVGEWNGDWATWLSYWYPGMPEGTLPPVDMIPGGAPNPGVACGTGPFILQRIDYALEWSVIKYPWYWRCDYRSWPNPPYPPEPSDPGIRPKGYFDRITERQRASAAILAELIAGDCDFGAVSRTQAPSLHVGGDRNGPTLDGIRLNMPVAGLTTASFHLTVEIAETPDDRYGDIQPADTLLETAIPSNFYSNRNVRQAVMHLINFTMILQDQLLGEAYQPATVAPTGLPYCYNNITRFAYNEATAQSYFQAASFGGTPLTNVGFTVRIQYNTGNTIRQAVAEQLASAINKVGNAIYAPNPNKFHASAQGVAWGEYIPAMDAHQLPAYMIGWVADYADIHNFVFPYMHTGGAFAGGQMYSNSTIDALLDQAVYLADGEATRGVLYYNAQVMFQQDAPTVCLYIAIGRGYMRNWVQNHYYNVLYPGFYGSNKWKWLVTTTSGTQGYLPGDIDFDAKVTMADVVATVAAFGSYYGKLGMPAMHARWNYYCDIDDQVTHWRDRKIDMGDIVTCVANFGKTSNGWVPPP